MRKLEPIKCEVKYAAADDTIFHIIEKKTGKDKLVSFGRVYPIKGLKRFVRAFEIEYGVHVTNKKEFYKQVKEDVKARRQN